MRSPRPLQLYPALYPTCLLATIHDHSNVIKTKNEENKGLFLKQWFVSATAHTLLVLTLVKVHFSVCFGGLPPLCLARLELGPPSTIHHHHTSSPLCFFFLQLRDHAGTLLSRQSKSIKKSMKAFESPHESPPIAVSSQTLKRPLNLS